MLPINEPHQSVNPSAPSSQRYLIALPTGTEGPCTIEELRIQLRTRRLNPSDRVLSEGDKKSRLLSDLIPDAESLQVRTDRVVRRKSTDGEGQTPPRYSARQPGYRQSGPSLSHTAECGRVAR